MKNWFKIHGDTSAVIASIILSILWMNSSVNEVRREGYELAKVQSERSDRLYEMFVDLLKEGKK